MPFDIATRRQPTPFCEEWLDARFSSALDYISKPDCQRSRTNTLTPPALDTIVLDTVRASSFDGGGDGIRTHDLLVANQMLSQLSYTPARPVKLSPSATVPTQSWQQSPGKRKWEQASSERSAVADLIAESLIGTCQRLGIP